MEICRTVQNNAGIKRSTSNYFLLVFKMAKVMKLSVGQRKKGDVKRRNNIFEAARLKTGGGRNEEKPLTPLEERILRLIGLDAADGLDMPDSESVPKVNEFHELRPELDTDQLNTQEFEKADFVECLLPDTADFVFNIEEHSASVPLSGTPQTNTPQATPQTKDTRVQYFKKRVRSKPLFMKNDNAQKMVEVKWQEH
ncbi:hypothetical protein AVEN_9412-1 [Araneus ventricosus]|uniref:Uncharacterized protein n=1 Tax=Araneus ventricosus TaxID=182803 RepID=A0A4Y2DJ91_ARAVE|nr:hypothetical protein AVEN_9412-1 [Araneus ventricosus]